MNIGPRAIDAGGGLAVLAAAFATYAGAVAPMLERSRTAESLRIELGEQEGRLEDARTDARALAAALERANARFAEGLASLRPITQANSMLGELAALAARHGLRIDEMTPRDPRAAGGLMELPLAVRGRGGFVEFTRFLADAHGTLDQLEVRGFSVQGDPAQSDQALVFALDLAWLAGRADTDAATSR